MLSLPVNSNPLAKTVMKKYHKPRIEKGIEAIYSLSIGLEVWIEHLTSRTADEDRSQMLEAAKILHGYCLDNLFKGWA